MTALPARPVDVAPVCALGTVLAYGATLAWDQHRDRAADGSLHGPYQPWQVVALAVLLGALAGWGGRRGKALPTAAVMTTVLTACFAVDAMTDADGDGLWPVGAVLVAAAGYAGTVGVALLASAWPLSSARRP